MMHNCPKYNGHSFSFWEKVAQQRRMRATRPTILTIAES
jgi:hypothetical protein